MIAPDLFEFAYVPDWYGQLEELERLRCRNHGNSESRAERQRTQSHLFWNGTYIQFFANRLLILIQKVIPEKQMAFFIWRMSVPSFIQDYTHDGTREFMDILKETIIQIL